MKKIKYDKAAKTIAGRQKLTPWIIVSTQLNII
jgi:hypothetical protein